MAEEKFVDPKVIFEMITMQQHIDGIVKDILERYNTSSPEGLKAALQHATWVGICRGKGWE